MFFLPTQLRLGCLALQTVPDLALNVAAQLSSSVLARGTFPLMPLPWLAVAPYFHFHRAQPFTSSHWKLFSRHSFSRSAISITGPWIHHYFLCFTILYFVSFTLHNHSKEVSFSLLCFSPFAKRWYSLLCKKMYFLLNVTSSLFCFPFSSYFFFLWFCIVYWFDKS